MPVLSIADVFTSAGLATLGQVIMIDLMLAGDNIVVLGTLAAGLPPKERRRVLGLGVGIALVCLVGFAFLATTLLHVVGLLFAGGLLLLWVGWKLFREIHPPKVRSEEHTSELQSLMRISYAVFCLKKKKNKNEYMNKLVE